MRYVAAERRTQLVESLNMIFKTMFIILGMPGTEIVRSVVFSPISSRTIWKTREMARRSAASERTRRRFPSEEEEEDDDDDVKR